MKKREDKYKDLFEELEVEDKEEQKKLLRKASIAVALIVLALIVIVTLVVYVFEANFGKHAGIAAWVILALLLAGYLYKDQIKSKFKKK